MAKIIFSTNDKIFSRLIRKFTKSEVSHVAFEYNEHSISHSTFVEGVGNIPKQAFKHINKIVAVYEILDENHECAKTTYRQQNSRLYGYFDIMYSMLAIILKRIVCFKNPIQDGLICSEYVSLYIDACLGTKLNSSSHPPTPQDLLEWCDKNLFKSTY